MTAPQTNVGNPGVQQVQIEGKDVYELCRNMAAAAHQMTHRSPVDPTPPADLANTGVILSMLRVIAELATIVEHIAPPGTLGEIADARRDQGAPTYRGVHEQAREAPAGGVAVQQATPEADTPVPAGQDRPPSDTASRTGGGAIGLGGDH